MAKSPPYLSPFCLHMRAEPQLQPLARGRGRHRQPSAYSVPSPDEPARATTPGWVRFLRPSPHRPLAARTTPMPIWGLPSICRPGSQWGQRCPACWFGHHRRPARLNPRKPACRATFSEAGSIGDLPGCKIGRCHFRSRAINTWQRIGGFHAFPIELIAITPGLFDHRLGFSSTIADSCQKAEIY